MVVDSFGYLILGNPEAFNFLMFVSDICLTCVMSGSKIL